MKHCYFKIPVSLRGRMIWAFFLAALLPMGIIQLFSYHTLGQTVENNVEDLTKINLEQASQYIQLQIDTFDDLLYQLYTSDEIVELIHRKENSGDFATYRYQLARRLREIGNIKPYIQSITVMTADDEIVFYDKLTASSEKNSWIDSFSIAPQSLYRQNVNKIDTSIYPSQYVGNYSSKPYYLFHMVHRIVDYKNITKEMGIVILSIDERVLEEGCSTQMKQETDSRETNAVFIVDQTGELITFPDKSYIQNKHLIPSKDSETFEQACKDLFPKQEPHRLSVQSLFNEELGWCFVNVSNQGNMTAQLQQQFLMNLLVMCISLVLLMSVSIYISKKLVYSVQEIVEAMQETGRGKWQYVAVEESTPVEVSRIAVQFNQMVHEIKELIEKIKSVTIKQKNAEIAMLEAQINPHFLYNTLDTINWMAIDHEEYEISSAISALGEILRYGINPNNRIVTIREEVEWLKQYLQLQQTRMKYQFVWELHVSPEVLSCRLHKLLFQPFVENCIVHAFDGTKQGKIDIWIQQQGQMVAIVISDNGRGFFQNFAWKDHFDVNVRTQSEKGHIGMENAVGRLKLYYGEQCEIQIKSEVGKGTTVYIMIPDISGDEL